MGKERGGNKMLLAGRDGKSNGAGIVVSEEISKDAVRVAKWQGRIIVAWMIVKRQLVCITYVSLSLTRKGGDRENGLHGRS